MVLVGSGFFCDMLIPVAVQVYALVFISVLTYLHFSPYPQILSPQPLPYILTLIFIPIPIPIFIFILILIFILISTTQVTFR